MLDSTSTYDIIDYSEEMPGLGLLDVTVARPIEHERQVPARSHLPRVASSLDPIAYFKNELIAYDLLDAAQEQGLARQLERISQAIASLILSCPTGADRFLLFIERALHNPPKKRMLATEKRYFSLRRETDDLTATEENRHRLQALVDARVTFIQRDSEPGKVLRHLVEAIDWPGPLLLAFARRLGNSCATLSALERALDEYMASWDIPSRWPRARHSERFNFYIAAYLKVRDTLVKHNLRLVFHIAKRYAQKEEQLLELIQEGCFGLIRAAEKFRAASGNRFSTYAHHWIDSRIRKARVNLEKLIPVTEAFNNELYQLALILEQQTQTRARVSVVELAQTMGVSAERIALLMQSSWYCLSLDQHADDDDSPSMHAKYADPSSGLMREVMAQDVAEQIDALMEQLLSAREIYVLNERFGRLDDNPKTSERIGGILGISRERVRQLEVGALAKLRDFVRNSQAGSELALYLHEWQVGHET